MPTSLIAPLIGVGASMLMDDSGSSQGSVQNKSGLTAEQQAAMAELWKLLSGQLSQPMAGYPGQTVAGMTGAEQTSQDLLSQYLQAPVNPLLTQASEILSSTMGRMTPEAMASFWETNIAPQQERLFREQTMPGVKEAWAGPGGGGYWSSGRASAQQRAGEVFGEQQATGLGNTIMRGQEFGAQLAPIAMQLGEYLDKLPVQKAEIAQALGSLPRVLEQAQMTSDFNEWMRLRPENSPYIQLMMQFIGLDTQYPVITPGEDNPWGGLLGGPLVKAAPDIGSAVSGWLNPTSKATPWVRG